MTKAVYVQLVADFDEDAGQMTMPVVVVKLAEPLDDGSYVVGDDFAFFEDLSTLEEEFGVLDGEGHCLASTETWFSGWNSYEIPTSQADELGKALVELYNKHHAGGATGYEVFYCDGSQEEMDEILTPYAV